TAMPGPLSTPSPCSQTARNGMSTPHTHQVVKRVVQISRTRGVEPSRFTGVTGCGEAIVGFDPDPVDVVPGGRYRAGEQAHPGGGGGAEGRCRAARGGELGVRTGEVRRQVDRPHLPAVPQAVEEAQPPRRLLEGAEPGWRAGGRRVQGKQQGVPEDLPGGEPVRLRYLLHHGPAPPPPPVAVDEVRSAVVAQELAVEIPVPEIPPAD